MNNPLAFTDPNGYFSFKKFFRAVVSIVVMYYTGGLVSGSAWATCTASGAAWGGVAAGAAGGFAGGLVASGGDLKAGLQGALTGGLFGAAGMAGGVGEAGANSAARYVAHAAAGCVSSVAGGGNCGAGAASAMFGKYTTNANCTAKVTMTNHAMFDVRIVQAGNQQRIVSTTPGFILISAQ